MPDCAECGNTGWLQGADRRSRRCLCRNEHLRMMANIPERYRDASFANYQLDGERQCFSAAHLWAQSFAANFPLVDDRGVVLVGTIGAGKTHIAIAILRAILTKGIFGRFYDYAELLREIQCSNRPDSDDSPMELLAPAMDLDVLVLDDFGTIKPSAFVLDTVGLLLNTRYRAKRTTILTTNFPDAASLLDPKQISLQERVGERTVSRLREMCRFVTMEGPDFRMTMHRPVNIAPRRLEGHA